MQLQQLTGLEIEKLANEYTEVSTEIEGYEAILADEARIMDIIREDIIEMKEKYGDARRTEIVGEVGEFDIEDLIAEEDVVVTLTHDGYIKRMPLATYRRQGRGGVGIIGSDAKEGDFIANLFIASTHDYLLSSSTTAGKLYWLKVYDIPDLGRTTKGRAIVNLLELAQEETHRGGDQRAPLRRAVPDDRDASWARSRRRPFPPTATRARAASRPPAWMRAMR